MTKRNFWKKSLLIIGIGTMPAYLFFPFGNSSCVSNAGLQTFYQAVGNASIDTLADASAQVFGEDGRAIIINPTAGFINNTWNNWVDEQVPDDPTFGSPWRS